AEGGTGGGARGEARGRLRERVLASDAGGRAVRADRLGALLLDDQRDRGAGLPGRAGRGAAGAGDRDRAVLLGARARPARDLDAAQAGTAGGGRAAPRARDDPRRRIPARPGRVARAEAVARERGKRLPHPLLVVGGGRVAQP